LKAGDTTEMVQAGGLSRTYILHVPSAYKGSSAVPLVVDFHPIGGSDTGEESSSPFKAQTDPEGVITAYPQGEPAPNFSAAWNVGPCCTSEINGAAVDDVAFARAIVAQVETKACIDTTRVYAVGFSMGGGMSHYLACHAADLFAAVSPASFDLLKENEDGCTPSRPIPVLSFRGEQDNVAIYAGGYSSVVTGMPITFLGAQACFQKWASIDGCTGSPSSAQSVTDSSANKTWTCQYYTGCSGGVQVGLCIDPSGGHEYGSGSIGWPFLKQFTLP
jgi:polyhydroxybutyrate depolymerase